MIPIGEFVTLRVAALQRGGALLTDGEEQVLLPSRFAPADLALDQELEVFVYADSENQLLATTQSPYAIVGDFALLEVVDLGPHGAFMDWGLEKDLFVPLSQQHEPMRRGHRYVVAVYIDERTGRIAAASKLGPHFDYDLTPLRVGQEVGLLAYGFTDLGTQVIVDNRYSGLIYASETFQPIELGDTLTGYVRAIRGDNKLDISLQRAGREAVDDAAGVVLSALEARGGTLELWDKSSPSEIYATLGISKKAFKNATGKLYRARRIVLGDGWIRLTDGAASDVPGG